jgi:hypothetical protein
VDSFLRPFPLVPPILVTSIVFKVEENVSLVFLLKNSCVHGKTKVLWPCFTWLIESRDHFYVWVISHLVHQKVHVEQMALYNVHKS